MGALHGCGTMYCGWEHGASDATAIRWVTLFYVPILPMGQFRLVVLTGFEKEAFLSSTGAMAAALVGHGTRKDPYLVKERLRLDPLRMLKTYLTAFVLLPILVSWPFLLLKLVLILFGVHPEWEQAPWFGPALIGFVSLALVNAVAVPLWAIQSARGYRGGLFSRKA